MTKSSPPDSPTLSAMLAAARSAAAPAARKVPAEIVQHGRARTDEYAWLRDENWQAVMRDPARLAPEIRAQLEAENAYVETVMGPTEALQRRLFEEMKGRIREDDASPPLRDGPFAYYTRFRTGGQYPVFARRPVDPATGEPAGEEEILLDGDREADGADYFDIADVQHSPDHRRIAWAVDRRGSEYYEIRIRDIARGEDFVVLAEEGAGGLAWAADSETVFWTWRDANGRPKVVYRSRVEDARAAAVYEEPDDGFHLEVSKSDGDSYIVISAHTHTTSELRLVDSTRPGDEPRLVAAREAGVEYDIVEAPDRFYFVTNADGATDFKIVSAPREAPGRENWTDVVPHRPGVLILEAFGFREWQVRLERENALPRIVVRRYADGQEHAIAFDEEAYALGVDPGFEFATDTLRFSYESPATPEEIYDYDMAGRTRALRKRQEVPSGHDPSDYVVRRLMAPAPDGETVPVTVLHRRDQPLDGSAPLLLYGYGSYGITIPAAFRIKPLSLADRGMVFAIAHVRGGKARGYRWYLDGKLEKKINTFKDFIAAGEHLADQGFTARGRIVAMGGSAGGLLVGAAANMAPDLFAGVIAAVPFVDILNTMSDPDLPLTPPEWPEWGDPITDPDAHARIAGYSPYDNVADQAYPHVLAIAGLTDPRVTYWEPAKWIARLRDRRADDRLTLLKTEMGAGHGGKTGRFDALKDDALEYAFALSVAGLADTAPRR